MIQKVQRIREADNRFRYRTGRFNDKFTLKFDDPNKKTFSLQEKI